MKVRFLLISVDYTSDIRLVSLISGVQISSTVLPLGKNTTTGWALKITYLLISQTLQETRAESPYVLLASGPHGCAQVKTDCEGRRRDLLVRVGQALRQNRRQFAQVAGDEASLRDDVGELLQRFVAHFPVLVGELLDEAVIELGPDVDPGQDVFLNEVHVGVVLLERVPAGGVAGPRRPPDRRWRLLAGVLLELGVYLLEKCGLFVFEEQVQLGADVQGQRADQLDGGCSHARVRRGDSLLHALHQGLRLDAAGRPQFTINRIWENRNPTPGPWRHLAVDARNDGPKAWRGSAVWAAAAECSLGLGFCSFPALFHTSKATITFSYPLHC